MNKILEDTYVTYITKHGVAFSYLIGEDMNERQVKIF